MAELLWTAGFDRELQEIFVFMEERLAGSGERFVLKLDKSLALLREFPNHAPLFRKVGRRLVLASGHGVFYQINGDRVVLVALLHLSLPIEAILKRLGEIPDAAS